MYENEIKQLEEIRKLVGDSTYGPAIDTAIALMRRASVAPHDEAAELSECKAVLAFFAEQSGFEDLECLSPYEQRECLLRFAQSRAAVRAESTDEIERLKARIQDMIDQEVGSAMDCAAHERELRAELAALKAAGAPKDEAAEDHACRELLPRTVSFSGVEVLNAIKLGRAGLRAEMQAEIERLRAMYNAEADALTAEIERLKGHA